MLKVLGVSWVLHWLLLFAKSDWCGVVDCGLLMTSVTALLEHSWRSIPLRIQCTEYLLRGRSEVAKRQLSEEELVRIQKAFTCTRIVVPNVPPRIGTFVLVLVLTPNRFSPFFGLPLTHSSRLLSCITSHTYIHTWRSQCQGVGVVQSTGAKWLLACRPYVPVLFCNRYVIYRYA